MPDKFSNPSLTLFYPMYNEIGHIEGITLRAIQMLEKLTNDFEILIINDGSTDGSEKIADNFAQSNPHIRVIHHDGNKGYGQALRTGFANATKDIVAYTDCDEPVDLNQFAEALPHLLDHDLVIGYRLGRWEGWRRFIYSIGYNKLVRLLFDVRVHDINFSFKLIRHQALHQLDLHARSVFIDGELLAEAVRNRLTIYQMPVEYQMRKHGASHFGSMRAATDTLKEIGTYWLRRHRLSAIRSAATSRLMER